MIRDLLRKIVGDPNEKRLKKLRPYVEEINQLEPEIQEMSDEELAAKTDEFKQRLEEGETMEDLLVEVFAVVREVANRQVGMRPYDVQLMGGIVLHQGNIAEMLTGEGKTLVATMPVYLNALAGQSVHLVTVNDYLAQRDAGWMGKVYRFLGLEVAVLVNGNQALMYDPEYDNENHQDERLQHLRPISKKEAYQADIIYGTNNEFGFDYLRDNMAGSAEDQVQRDRAYAIVDEVDSILIDEARTPLIISAPAEESAAQYQQFARIARRLDPETDYTIDEKSSSASLTDEGIGKVEEQLEVDNLYNPEHVHIIFHLEQALKAETLFQRDHDYVVRDGDVIIVDEFTGRLMPGRRYSEGLHQAIEAKEGVSVLQESMTLASISFQNYFRLYDKLAGMTGTAKTEEEEFQTIYDLDVTVVPTNEPNIRKDLPDRIYKTVGGKMEAIARDVKQRQEQGQPVLIGTVSIEKNEQLSEVLDDHDIPHEILNAKNNEKEAGIVAKAGQKGAVTLATNIAGRGTDIVLEEGVTDLGGLHVLGSERHESRRIDNQLRGRCGRQGDPGSTQFYVALNDELMRVFGGDRIAGLMNTMNIDEDTPIENNMVSKALESAQKRVESHNYDIRKQVVQYDDVMNKHRETIYSRRNTILRNEVKDDILDFIAEEIVATIQAHHDPETQETDREAILEQLSAWLPMSNQEQAQLKAANSVEQMEEQAYDLAEKHYQIHEEKFGSETMRQMERWLYLSVLDRLWMEHLENMSHMREGIGLQGLGQRDPLAEYKKRGFRMFNELLTNIESEVARTIFKIAPQPATTRDEVETDLTEAAAKAVIASGDEEGEDTQAATKTIRRTKEKVGRNDPCPCGSGRKYKKCGLVDAPEHKGS